MALREAVIFDLDGTLVDVSGVRHLLDGEARSFRAFQEAAVGCPADSGMVDLARERHADGDAVLIVSSREFIWLDMTLDWLDAQGVEHDGVYLRIVGDYRPDVEVKRDLLDDIVADGYRVREAWDDKPEVCEMWSAQGIVAHVHGT